MRGLVVWIDWSLQLRGAFRQLLISLVCAVFLVFIPLGNSYGQAYHIDTVAIEGNKRIDAAALRAQLKFQKGDVTEAQVSEEVKALYATGFFEQVSASVISQEGKRVLRYKLVEKAVVRKVFIRGNKEVEESDLSEVLKFDARRFFDKTKVDGLMRQAVMLYQNKGYYDAAFEYAVVAVGENQVDVTFTVTEGKRYKIRAIEFRGLRELDDSDLKGAMQTSRYKWWNSWLTGTGRLNQEMLENDKILLRQYFLDNGFLDATVGDPVIEKYEGGLRITFDISEGPVFAIGAITASGDLFHGSVEETLENIATERGETFSASTVRQDSFLITERISDEGFAFANVVPNTSVNRSDQTVDIDFSIAKGKLVSVNRINIKGNDKTYDNVIRRELKIDEQERYSGSKIRRSQELLQRLGYFEEVNISQEPVDNDKVDLSVNVREGSTGSFSAGAGYSSSDGPIFNFRLSENNILGTGRRASLYADVGSERDSIILSLDDRRLMDSHVFGGIDLQRTFREYADFDRRISGGSLTLGYPLEEVFGESFEDFNTDVKYEYLDINIGDIDEDSAAQLVRDSEGTSTASGFTPRIFRNTINNPLNPTKGSRQEVSIELTGVGGTEQFYLIEGKNTLYHPLFESSYGDLVFSWRTTVGYGETYDNDPFPLYRRYFPGGINSVRGYKARSLGPKDEDGNEFGGSKELVNNFELIFPLVNPAGLKGVVFYDAGEAFDDNDAIAIDDLRTAYGFGIRWSSPLGPIRVEFGFPIDRQEGEDSMVTFFSFGAPL